MARWGFNTGLDGHRVTPLDEHAAEEIADALGYIYEQANQRMLKNVAARLARGVTTYGWAERKAGEVGAARRQLESDLAQARRERMSLLDGLAERCAMSGSQKFYQDIGGMLGNTAHISPNSQKAAYILADMNNTLNAAERRILRQFDDRYADVIGRVSSEFATGVMNTRQAVGDALRAFADQGISGFIDRGGHHWTLRDYSEMAVLTAIERATLSSYVDTMQSYGFDLAVIDGHAGSCPICTAWEGVIVSVSGEDHRYPSLGEAENEGVFHPRCVHGITTYYDGITHAPRGGFRDHPRAVQQPNAEYTARSQQRYMERQIRKYKDRLIVAQTPQQKMMARNKIREWEDALDEHIDKQPASNYLYRHRDRETVTTIAPATKREKEQARIQATNSKSVPLKALDAEGFVQRFNSISDKKEVNESIYRCAVEMLQHRNDTTGEDLYLINGITGEVLYANTTSTAVQSVTYDDATIAAIDAAHAANIPIISLHNHPNSMPPSLDDGASAFAHGYSKGVVVGHNLDVWTYTPTNDSYSSEQCAEAHNRIAQMALLSVDFDDSLWYAVLGEYGMEVEKKDA